MGELVKALLESERAKKIATGKFVLCTRQCAGMYCVGRKDTVMCPRRQAKA